MLEIKFMPLCLLDNRSTAELYRKPLIKHLCLKLFSALWFQAPILSLDISMLMGLLHCKLVLGRNSISLLLCIAPWNSLVLENKARPYLIIQARKTVATLHCYVHLSHYIHTAVLLILYCSIYNLHYSFCSLLLLPRLLSCTRNSNSL